MGAFRANSQPVNFTFCLKEKGSDKKVKSADGTSEQIQATICYQAGGAAKIPDDVVFVVDKSGSMSENLNCLSTVIVRRFWKG